MEKLQERNSNFELLRIIAMLFIVLYHIIIHGQVLGNSVNAGLSIIIYLVMYMTLVHVNSFILLTGFFQSTGKFKQSNKNMQSMRKRIPSQISYTNNMR